MPYDDLIGHIFFSIPIRWGISLAALDFYRATDDVPPDSHLRLYRFAFFRMSAKPVYILTECSYISLIQKGQAVQRTICSIPVFYRQVHKTSVDSIEYILQIWNSWCNDIIKQHRPLCDLIA